jgi:hypothetical protein
VVVNAEDVRAYGPTAAVVLSTLRDQGCTPSIPLMVKYAAIGRICGLNRKTVRRAVLGLARRGAVRVERYRVAGALMVRTVHKAPERAEEGQGEQEGVTRRRRDVLARLDTLRSLLEVVG